MSRIVEAFDRMCEADEYNHIAEVADFLSTDPKLDLKSAYDALELAFKRCYDEYKDILSKENDWQYIDDIRQMQRDFYNRWIDFAKRCRELSNIKSITGYGLDDALKIKFMEKCRALDYNFPYGWK